MVQDFDHFLPVSSLSRSDSGNYRGVASQRRAFVAVDFREAVSQRSPRQIAEFRESVVQLAAQVRAEHQQLVFAKPALK